VTIEYKELRDTTGELFDQAMQLYLEAFPANERHPLAVIKSRIEVGDSKIYVGTLSGKVACMALMWYFKKINYVLLDYIAVGAEFRSLKIGSVFLEYLVKEGIADGRTMVFEVEHPAFGDNPAERKRRVAFYIKNGAYIIDDFVYKLPPLDGKVPTEMMLMLYPAQAIDSYSPDDVRSIVVSLYNELYGRDENDPLLLSFINTIPATIKLANNEA
jgi:GNAT superfamily N-acetyltransferase